MKRRMFIFEQIRMSLSLINIESFLNMSQIDVTINGIDAIN